jgi:hypothetical protein
MIAEVAPAGQQGARIDQRQAVGGTVTERSSDNPAPRTSRRRLTLETSPDFSGNGQLLPDFFFEA